MLTNILPSFSNHIPGAVPLLLGITVQLSGTSACLRLRSISGRFSFEKMLLTFSNAASFIINELPKYSQSTGLVISSAVGPSPPVIRTIAASRLSSSRARMISALLSPTDTLRFSHIPALFSSCAIHALLVSTTWPMSSSSPTWPTPTKIPIKSPRAHGTRLLTPAILTAARPTAPRNRSPRSRAPTSSTITSAFSRAAT